MTLSQIFNFSIFYVSVFWGAMILFPNWSVTKKIMNSFLPFIPLSVLYLYFLLTPEGLNSIVGGLNPQLEQYQELFSQGIGAVSVTIHMLAMDILAGRWIYWQGQEKNIWTRHSLLLTVFFGPVGVLSHLITAYFFNKKNDKEEATTDAAVS